MRKIFFTWLSLLVFSFVFQGAGALRAGDFCVDPGRTGTHTSLQDALGEAEANGQDDTIKVVQGTYNGSFAYGSTEGYSLTLEGGYTSGCDCKRVNPPNTILNGDGSGSVLSVYDLSGGNLTVDGFTIKNGNGVYGGGIYMKSRCDSGKAGDIWISNNIVTANSADSSGGGIYATSVSHGDPIGPAGNITLVNNLVTGNRASLYGGGVLSNSQSEHDSAGTVTFTNNSVNGNKSGNLGGGAALYIRGESGGTIHTFNSIVRGNSTEGSGDDIFISKGLGNAFGLNNDYHEKAGDDWDGDHNNINEDPCFRDPGYWDDGGTPGDPSDDIWIKGDFHLLSDSPCIDEGDNSAPSLPDSDFEGDERTIDGDNDGSVIVDMGADEFALSAMPWMPLLLLD